MTQTCLLNESEQEDVFTGLSGVNRNYLADEGETVTNLLNLARARPDLRQKIHISAKNLVRAARQRKKNSSGLQAFLSHYDLSSEEGVILMCLAEALLRIPDNATMDKFIADKLSSADWHRHSGESDSLFVNASTWALMLSDRMLRPDDDVAHHPGKYLGWMIARLEEPVLRTAIKGAMRVLAFQFVMGQTIQEATRRAQKKENCIYRYSFDLLGEAVMTRRDAEHYQQACYAAIRTVGESADESLPLMARPGISVKLSALCPRFEFTQKAGAIEELSKKLLQLSSAARNSGIGLTVDAEETDRLEILLTVFAKVYPEKELSGWPGLGIAVQSYQKRALPVLMWLNKLAEYGKRMIPVRLVKGAYWDMEIKQAQQLGLKDFPVFTRKCNTDVSYLACARCMLDECRYLYPQFATHNAHTLAYVWRHAGNRDYEFQRLHGMGEEMYADVVDKEKLNIPCRVYAPVGAHEELLPYLVRRLLENGANSSFVNQLVHDTNVDEIIRDPVALAESFTDEIKHPGITLPSQMFAPGRINSAGINFADDNEFLPLVSDIEKALQRQWASKPVVRGMPYPGKAVEVIDPANRRNKIGITEYACPETIQLALDTAYKAWTGWNATKAEERAGILERAADLFEEHRSEFIALCIREAGKTVRDSHDDVREAIDFLRYYATCCRDYFSEPIALPGPAGESNKLGFQGRGVFLCISPWNFPVAICAGQIAAALAAGNTVIAKPAEQTSLVAGLICDLLYQAGIPEEALSFVPCGGEEFGNIALSDSRIAGIVFTGSTETAQIINRKLARRDAPLATVIAETGGQNAMIADSSALPEQVVRDVVLSAFNSTGQRCSALRVLYLQEEIAGRALELLIGYLDGFVTGDPMELSTDMGPVIDKEAQEKLEQHIKSMQKTGNLIYRCASPPAEPQGYFVPPAVIEIESIKQLEYEVFGPVLHVIRYPLRDLGKMINEINDCGYGLTFGIHSRIERRVEQIRARIRVGNVYVNRNMIGAVVESQPFGGCRLSGTGPKAGGPHYLLRFASEQTCTINTAATGGNASLLTAI